MGFASAIICHSSAIDNSICAKRVAVHIMYDLWQIMADKKPSAIVQHSEYHRDRGKNGRMADFAKKLCNINAGACRQYHSNFAMFRERRCKRCSKSSEALFRSLGGAVPRRRKHCSETSVVDLIERGRFCGTL